MPFQRDQGIVIKSTDMTCIAGFRGTGKTTLAKYLASLCEPRLLIYDPLGQYDTFDDKYRFVPPVDNRATFESVCRKVIAQGNMTFVIEEAEKYIGQSKGLGPDATELINRGRNWGIGVFAVTRRVQRINKDFFDLCNHCIFFRCGFTSRQYFKDIFYDDGPIHCIRDLKQWEFLYYNLDTDEYSIHTLTLGARPRIIGQKASKEERDYDEETWSKRRVRTERDTVEEPVERGQEPRR